MNYAEDRLDRRARYLSSQENENDEISNNKSKPQSPLDADLCHACHLLNSPKYCHGCSIDDDDDNDNGDSNIIFTQKREGTILFLRAQYHGHELLGRTLRDYGLNSNSLFHYGQAWLYQHQIQETVKLENDKCKTDHPNDKVHEHGGTFSSTTNTGIESVNKNNIDDEDTPETAKSNANSTDVLNMSDEDKAIGDYAQLTEFNGVPEIGILCLFYYMNGGSIYMLDEAHDDYEDNQHNNNEKTHLYETKKSCKKESAEQDIMKCPCGMKQCEKISVSSSASSKYFIPNSICKSSITNDILESLNDLDQCLRQKQCQSRKPNINKDNGDTQQTETAASILDNIEKQMKMNCLKHKLKLQRQKQHQQQQNLRLQKEMKVESTDTAIQHSSSISIIDPKLQFWNKSTSKRPLTPLLQILLMKLLYISPIGSSFLYIACEAVKYLSFTLPIQPSLSSSSLSKASLQYHQQALLLRNKYKSHWAYYLFIYKQVLGTRIKKSKRLNGQTPYHVPVWDIVHGLDCRRNSSFVSDDILEKEDCVLRSTSYKYVEYNITSLLRNLLTNQLSSSSELNQNHLYPNIIPIIKPTYVPFQNVKPSFYHNEPIYALGDSHVLSIAWQTIQIAASSRHNNDDDVNIKKESIQFRTIIPYPVTGLKAWHTRKQTKFFTYNNLKINLQRLPSATKTILLSAGEIDCREGIGGFKLQGYNENCDDAVYNTVLEYVLAIQTIAEEYDLQILLLPVAPHAYRSEKNGKAKGRAMRRERMQLWNDLLRSMLSTSSISSLENGIQKQKVFLLDYEKDLRVDDASSPVGFVLNKIYDADYTHMNSSFLPLLERAMHTCGCDLRLI